MSERPPRASVARSRKVGATQDANTQRVVVRSIGWLGVAVIGVEGAETPSGIVKRALQLSL